MSIPNGGMIRVRENFGNKSRFAVVMVGFGAVIAMNSDVDDVDGEVICRKERYELVYKERIKSCDCLQVLLKNLNNWTMPAPIIPSLKSRASLVLFLYYQSLISPHQYDQHQKQPSNLRCEYVLCVHHPLIEAISRLIYRTHSLA